MLPVTVLIFDLNPALEGIEFHRSIILPDANDSVHHPNIRNLGGDP
jgi:hypothetical protein